jgi:hypothetical protein
VRLATLNERLALLEQALLVEVGSRDAVISQLRDHILALNAGGAAPPPSSAAPMSHPQVPALPIGAAAAKKKPVESGPAGNKENNTSTAAAKPKKKASPYTLKPQVIK